MSEQKKIQWDTIGKISILVLVLGMAFFFPFNKYLGIGAKKAVKNQTEQTDMTSALMEEETAKRDYKKNPQIYWRRNGKGYLLYINGRQLTKTESSWSGDDLMVHDPSTNITYRLPNFKNLKDSQLRKGEISSK